MPEFSVVIPLYNGAPYVGGALDCVLRQTLSDWEAVVVDDGSQDGGAGASVVERVIRSHPSRAFRLVRQRNRGLGGARNTAIRGSTGRFIALLDQDDVWYPEKLERVRAAFAADPDAGIVCNHERVRRDGALNGVMAYGPSAPDMFRTLLFCGNRLSTSGVTIRREVFDRVGLFREDGFHLVEDYDLWLRAAREGFRFIFLEEPLGEWVVHGRNYSTTQDEAMCSRILQVMDDNFAAMEDRRFWDGYRLRRQKARVWLDAAVLQLKRREPGAFLHSVLRAAAQNPLLVDSLAHKFLVKLQRSGRRLG